MKKSWTKDQISLIQNVENVFDLREKIIACSLFLSEAKYKGK